MGGNCSTNEAVKSARRIFINKTRKDKVFYLAAKVRIILK
jgi:hypothetical protein